MLYEESESQNQLKETLFDEYEKYNTNNKFKCYIISKLTEIEKSVSQELFISIKKNILPYLMEKRELKVRYNSTEYNVEFIKKQNVDIPDNISECSTIGNNANANYEKDNEQCQDQYNNQMVDNFNENQTYLVESDDSDEESLIQNAIQLTKKKLQNLTVPELREIMRNKNLNLSKNGIYYTKNEIIKKLLKHR
jgi:hypothetical protein